MARIAGVNIPLNKRAEIGLTYIFGIGQPTAQDLLDQVGIDHSTQVKDLTEDEVVKLREAVDQLDVEGDLRRERSQNVKRLMEIGSYRGLRHRRGLPVRGPDLGADRYLELMAHDKKVEDGKLRLVLLKAVGEAVIHGGAGRGDILAAIEARQGD